MKKLNELYPDSKSEVLIKDIKINSKEITDGDLFVCTMGVNADRHDFIDDAINHGAAAIVVSKDVEESRVPVIKVTNTNEELPLVCRRFYDYPDKEIKIIGITGTDGKTSTATIIQTLLGKDKCGYIGTNGISWGNEERDNPNTTPDVHLLYKYFREMLNDGCKYVAMEASSEAFFRNRLVLLNFDYSAYTNITKEHLNIHGTYENYVSSKLKLFRQTKSDGFSILNRDEEHFNEAVDACNSKYLTYGEDKKSNLCIMSFSVKPTNTLITFKYLNKEYSIDSPMLGDFNVQNLACALLTCLSMGYSMDSLVKNIKDIKVNGRLDLLDTDTPYYVMVDYAHTPNGITRLLNFVHTLDINRSIVVIGQAGERDYLKRPEVGSVVVNNASFAIFTYEDPRSEDPKDICNDIVKDIKDTHDNYSIIIDRTEAIQKAVDMAKDGDMVLILGKGNETYQKLKTETIYYNDEEEAYKAVENRKSREKVTS